MKFLEYASEMLGWGTSGLLKDMILSEYAFAMQVWNTFGEFKAAILPEYAFEHWEKGGKPKPHDSALVCP